MSVKEFYKFWDNISFNNFINWRIAFYIEMVIKYKISILDRKVYLSNMFIYING